VGVSPFSTAECVGFYWYAVDPLDMFGGGGGMNPRKMKQMMEQMGIDLTEIDAEEVVIRTPDEELYFTDAQVQRMDAQGQETYQIVGSPETRDRTGTESAEGGAAAVESGSEPDSDSDDADAGASDIPQADVEIVAGRTGASEAEAREALEATDGDLAAAVERLE
jgi:nascent polypeptide-associated complex subunit alpha